MTIPIGFSPCPNDTFIFDALVNKKIDTGEFEFKPVLADVQSLNEWALEGRLPICKISYAVLPLVLDKYKLLQSGGALGKGVGPLLISKYRVVANVSANPIAIPGKHTTAHLLFSLAYPQAQNKIFLPYNAVEDFVLQGKGMGVIIHENRFTFQQRGLYQINDLGSFWERTTHLPIPLGGIVVSREMAPEKQKKIEVLIKKSIQFAFSVYPQITGYTRMHAQELSEDVIRRHIDLYVNDFSTALGDEGRLAVLKLLEIFAGQHPSFQLQAEELFV